jgi:hypothetical protein
VATTASLVSSASNILFLFPCPIDVGILEAYVQLCGAW